VKIKLKAEIE